MMALVGGAELPGRIGSSVSVEEAPSEESLTYLTRQLQDTRMHRDLRGSGIELGEFTCKGGITIFANLFQSRRFSLGDDTNLVSE
jgi:hypothetical protein